MSEECLYFTSCTQFRYALTWCTNIEKQVRAQVGEKPVRAAILVGPGDSPGW